MQLHSSAGFSMHTPMHGMTIAWVGLSLAVGLAAGCASDPDYCRFDPHDCGGGIGGDCADDADCQDGYCCRDESNCGGGMCTFMCDGAHPCPDDMRCEHNTCFFACSSDADCASGQSCEHDGVCEWP